MKEYPLVSIIVVNYNGKKYLKDCFSSLYNLNFPPNKLEIVMVDNGSSDSSLEFVKENFSRVEIIENNINNYCKANNLGIKSAKGKYIAILNNDTKVDENWLVELVKVINQDDSIGAVAGKILFLDGRLQGTGHYEFPHFYWSDRGFKENDKGQYDKTEEVPSISHCATLYRKKCFDNVGLLDEDFNMYMEDVDMSIRAKQKGWRLFYVPKSVVYHKFHGSADESQVNFYCERNRLLLLAKHYPQKLADTLFGKGYFTGLNKKSELIKILPDVFSKLIKHHNVDIVSSILPNIFENLNKILNFEKDYLMKQLDLEREQSDSLQEVLSQKDQQLSQKDQQLSQKDQELSNLKEKINQDLNLLSQKDIEISHLKEEINQIYHSQTYQFIAQPIWKVLNFLKGIKAAFQYKKPRLFSSSQDRKNLCFAYFSAQSKIAKYKQSNQYCLKITNDTKKEQSVKIKIEIENNDIIYAYISKNIMTQSKSSIEVIIDYDWHETAVCYMDNQASKPDELRTENFDSPGFYCLSAYLFDSTDVKLDRLSIFQKLEL